MENKKEENKKENIKSKFFIYYIITIILDAISTLIIIIMKPKIRYKPNFYYKHIFFIFIPIPAITMRLLYAGFLRLKQRGKVKRS